MASDLQASVQARLKEREDARRAAIKQHRKEKEKDSVEQETAEYFFSTFSQKKQAIENLLLAVEDAAECDMKMLFDNIASEVHSLQKFVSDSTIFLTPYDIRNSQQQVTQLQQMVAKKQDSLLPSKKFAFKTRKKLVSANTTNAVSISENFSKPSGNPAVLENCAENGSPAVEGDNSTLPTNSIVVKDKNQERIVLEAEEVQAQDVSISNLASCTVRIPGAPGTLHVSLCRDTCVLVGPVSGSVFIDECSRCTFVVACQQLRVHSTVGSTFYLHVTSRAIIEDCTELCFTPYNWSYPLLSHHFSVSGLSLLRNNWDKVDDFNWLAKSKHSPNWSILPDHQRQSSWDVNTT